MDAVARSTDNGFRQPGCTEAPVKADQTAIPGSHRSMHHAESVVGRQGRSVIFRSALTHASHPHAGPTEAMRLGCAARRLPTRVRVHPCSDTLQESGAGAGPDKHGCVLVACEDGSGRNRFVDRTVDGTPFPPTL